MFKLCRNSTCMCSQQACMCYLGRLTFRSVKSMNVRWTFVSAIFLLSSMVIVWPRITLSYSWLTFLETSLSMHIFVNKLCCPSKWFSALLFFCLGCLSRSVSYHFSGCCVLFLFFFTHYNFRFFQPRLHFSNGQSPTQLDCYFCLI